MRFFFLKSLIFDVVTYFFQFFREIKRAPLRAHQYHSVKEQKKHDIFGSLLGLATDHSGSIVGRVSRSSLHVKEPF